MKCKRPNIYTWNKLFLETTECKKHYITFCKDCATLLSKGRLEVIYSSNNMTRIYCINCMLGIFNQAGINHCKCIPQTDETYPIIESVTV